MDIEDKLDLFEELICDLYYEFGENSQFFKDNGGNLTKRQKELIKSLYVWKNKGMKDIKEEFESHKYDIEDLEKQIEDLEDDISRLEDENADLQDRIGELESQS